MGLIERLERLAELGKDAPESMRFSAKVGREMSEAMLEAAQEIAKLREERDLLKSEIEDLMERLRAEAEAER